MLCHCCSNWLKGAAFDAKRKRMKLACHWVISSSAQRLTPAGSGAA